MPNKDQVSDERPNPAEILAKIDDALKKRMEALNRVGGFGGPDLRNQADMIDSVLILGDDINFLFATVRELARAIKSEEQQ